MPERLEMDGGVLAGLAEPGPLIMLSEGSLGTVHPAEAVESD